MTVEGESGLICWHKGTQTRKESVFGVGYPWRTNFEGHTHTHIHTTNIPISYMWYRLSASPVQLWSLFSRDVTNRDWKDSPVVKNTCCSDRGLRFYSQYPCGGPTARENSSSRRCGAFFCPPYTGKIHIKINNISLKLKRRRSKRRRRKT